MNTDLLAKHIGEIADQLEAIHREQRILIDSLYAMIEEWESYGQNT